MFTADDFKKFRIKLGFSDQAAAKKFFGAKDLLPGIDQKYLEQLNGRLMEIVVKIDRVIWQGGKVEDLDAFVNEYVAEAFAVVNQNNILPRLNNQGRRPEEVYFSWMRGYVVVNYFLKALGLIFETDVTKIDPIGDDSLTKVETFKRTPTADLEINTASGPVRIEMQSGFVGINDIKQHKVLEAKRIFREKSVPTVAVHADLFNGQVAFIKLDEIEDDSVNWITRINMDDGLVWNIDQNFFFWNLRNIPLPYSKIIKNYYA